MILSHVGLVCASEKNADRFYIGLLGLEKAAPKILPAEISRALFNMDSELTVIKYTRGSVVFEIFIDASAKAAPDKIDHACLAVDDLDAFLTRCKAMNAPVIQVPKGGKIVTFVSDFDGNRFEITGG
ncbi:MAG: VOC family protein [Pseudomonadota bacterium]